MFVSVKDYRKLRPFARKTGTKIILLEKYGVPFFLHRFRKRKIFFGGMAACIVLVYVMSLFVWNIHIEGNVMQNSGKTEKRLKIFLFSAFLLCFLILMLNHSYGVSSKTKEKNRTKDVSVDYSQIKRIRYAVQF